MADEDLPALIVTAERLAEHEGVSRWAALAELVAALDDDGPDLTPG